MRIKLKLSPDTTFLSQVIYEGVLYALNSVSRSSFRFNEVDLPDDFLCIAYREMNDKRIDGLSIPLTDNDYSEGKRKKIVNKLLERLGIRERLPERTYRELLKILKDRCQSISIERKEITLQTRIKGNNVFIDEPKRRSDLAAPQLFKIDRYTGISILEMGLTSKHLGLRSSFEAILIGLMGIYSSHITTVRQQQQKDGTYHYFVFLSPDEIADLLSSGDHYKLRNIYSIKESLRELLSETLHSSVISEVMVLEVMLSTKIRSELESKNLDKVDFNIFKISPEERQTKKTKKTKRRTKKTNYCTYKIYETVPITVYRNPMFYEILQKRGIRADKVCEELHKALSPGGAIMKALSSFNSMDKYSEADAILRGVFGLFRFVSLTDAQGLFQFLRSLGEACTILKDDERANYRVREYTRIMKSLSYAF